MCRLCRVARDEPFRTIDIPFLATRVLYSKATLSREHSRSCLPNIRCSTWGFLLLTKSICEHCFKILQHLSSSTGTREVVLRLNARE